MNALRIVITAAVICIAVALMILGATAGNAQGASCAPADTLTAGMAANYGEVPICLGICGAGQCVLFGNAETQTWTMVRVEGPVACVVVHGTGYAGGDDLPMPPAGTEG
jgi:hypothetical protein